jgi:hypothetical protein
MLNYLSIHLVLPLFQLLETDMLPIHLLLPAGHRQNLF